MLFWLLLVACCVLRSVDEQLSCSLPAENCNLSFFHRKKGNTEGTSAVTIKHSSIHHTGYHFLTCLSNQQVREVVSLELEGDSKVELTQ